MFSLLRYNKLSHNILQKFINKKYISDINNTQNCITCTTKDNCNKIKYCLTENIYFKYGYDQYGSIVFRYENVQFNKTNDLIHKLNLNTKTSYKSTNQMEYYYKNSNIDYFQNDGV